LDLFDKPVIIVFRLYAYFSDCSCIF
jgi:hypothetical protein